MSRGKALNFIDIGANLVDSMYQGIYNGSQKHPPDLNNVLDRAWKAGLRKIIITGTDLKESAKAVELAKDDERLFSTVGCHPTTCNQMENSDDSSSYMDKLVQLCENNKDKVVAIGEFGLDFDRLHFCPKDVQLRWFEKQILAFQDLKLPLFLHCRNAATELIDILSKYKDKFVGGVVHSFDGSIDQARNILDLGLYIGLNGCSLKTEENLEVVKDLPCDRILLETDSPWCDVRPSHAGHKYIVSHFDSNKKEKWTEGKLIKGRNEPCNIIQVLEIVAKVKGEDAEQLGQTIYENTEKLFFSNLKRQ